MLLVAEILEVVFCPPHICVISMTLLSVELFIFGARPLVNLQCNQLVTVIYVMFSVTPDFYLNDNPARQWITCNNSLISQNNYNRVR